MEKRNRIICMYMKIVQNKLTKCIMSIGKDESIGAFLMCNVVDVNKLSFTNKVIYFGSIITCNMSLVLLHQRRRDATCYDEQINSVHTECCDAFLDIWKLAQIDFK